MDFKEELEKLVADTKSLIAKCDEDKLADIVEKLREERIMLISKVELLKRDAEEYEERKKSEINQDIVSLKKEKDNITNQIAGTNLQLRDLDANIAFYNEKLKAIKATIETQQKLMAEEEIKSKQRFNELSQVIKDKQEMLDIREKELDIKTNDINLRIGDVERKESDFLRNTADFNKEMDIRNRQLIEAQNALNSGTRLLTKEKTAFENYQNKTSAELENRKYNLDEREKIIKEAGIRIAKENTELEKQKSEIFKNITDLKTNWEVFKQEKDSYAFKLKKLGG